MGKKAPKKVIKGSRYKHTKHGVETRYEEKNAEHPRVDLDRPASSTMALSMNVARPLLGLPYILTYRATGASL